MSSIVIIAPFESLAKVAEETCTQLQEQIPVIIGNIDGAVRLAQEVEKDGTEVIISRGTLALKITQSGIHVPVVQIPITGYDLLKAFLTARQLGKKIGIADTPDILRGIESLESMFDCQIEKHPIYSLADVEPAMASLMNKGIDVLIGKLIYVQKLEKSDIRTVILSSGSESIIQAINEAKKLLEVRRAEVAQTEQLRAILDFITDGVIAVNDQERVTVCNPAAEKILKISSTSIKGRRMDDFLTNSGISDVLRSGKEELNQIHEENGVNIIISHLPIRHGDKVIGALSTFQEISKLQQQEQEIRKKLSYRGHVTKYQLKDIVGKSSIFLQAIDKVRKYATVNSTVLLTGETGSGKEVFAHFIHNMSSRSNGPFVAINCAAIPEHLLESELFGYVEGAFTGAKKGGKAGLFELAHGGTIFLDEIGELAELLQVRLLRVLQEREVMRLGDERVIPIDVRVVAASNRNLEDMVLRGKFRDDLFYRINVLRIVVPSLRDRKEDIPLISDHIIQELKTYLHKEVTDFDSQAMSLMQQYSWPGNIRELRNFVERAMILSSQKTINVETVLEAGGTIFEEMCKGTVASHPNGSKDNEPPSTRGNKLCETEKDHILQVLKQVDGNQTKAAKILGIGRTTLWRKLNE